VSGAFDVFRIETVQCIVLDTWKTNSRTDTHASHSTKNSFHAVSTNLQTSSFPKNLHSGSNSVLLQKIKSFSLPTLVKDFLISNYFKASVS
jgi:indole-3-glycerol phosphate synthase